MKPILGYDSPLSLPNLLSRLTAQKIKKTKTGIPILVHFCYSAEREGLKL